MPKRYRIQLSLFSETNQLLDEKSHPEFYDDDDEAKKKFAEKDKAARAAGKGKPAG